MSWTVNVRGGERTVEQAKAAGYHAYCASGVTAIETKAKTEQAARAIASRFGAVLYAFE